MLSFTKIKKRFFPLFLGFYLLGTFALSAQSSLTLYTPFTTISVPPGQSIDYTIDVINNGKEVCNVPISLSGIPKDWTYDLKAGGWNVSQVSVLPGEKKSLNLKVEVPFKINKGNYHFKVLARGYTTLSLNVNVNKQGTYQTELTSDQANMQGHASASFTYNVNLKNRTAETQLYGLTATAAPGWEVTFKANMKQTTSVEIEPNNSANVTVEVNPPDNTTAGSYVVPIKAATNSTAATLDLQVVITGSYSMEVGTPSGLLNTNITAGETKKLEMEIRNTGSTPISNATLTATTPANWEITFEPKKVETILAGNSARVTAIIKADKKAIPGDYLTTIQARTPEANASTEIRVSVRTSLIWGWMGIFIILVAMGIVYFLFRKFGRR